MKSTLKKLVRTGQTRFPGFLDAKFAIMRRYRNALGIPFERDFRALRLFPDQPDALYLDVGANRGQSTDAILMTTRRSRIQLFEPNPLLWEKLERQYAGNPRVVIHKVGLGDAPSDQVLHIPFYKQWMFDGLSSFDEAKARNWLKGRIFGFRDEDLTVRKVPCHIRTLDDFQLDPFFLKLDIQGYEYQALRGAEATIRRSEPIVLLESPSDEIFAFLKRCGYQHYAFKGDTFVPGARGEMNTFLMTQSKVALIPRHIARAG